ncbi:hypothetical protein A2631_04875 [Candidatus Daviesbacteria bacterium RIFCSPHIGHO2_01_FULL_44_29]|uniref:ABC transporter domain-containing protein n=1 Tax=Candidatus Daviesbacteria bacterium RIFCSPHIGHO2_02_FULL_43_12 TaxID=1797776 RepID=A0A1F5KGX8_9BACT|nr:MAG: hypothetical protein A2631_04875 [Candidatus Daviesbacteria bacterium RIFCSPHIGHO2_01_FULL_44_29]OGE40055.1 MAG: hypothetical protein A3D25_04605 [Candidatus Daviesbacteria bacterium RIFCSPHIGHO2_02_FULL_43_12]OGE41463.1 MAG: hypothetical protein A3E86_05205 [Candidatus Daviesbacteria bacterium RIFCSPHIGHO2_12_FULL_47_45]OGE70265.1 MAG: hypothetical protein A3B55_00965 [Candidatus Daviesbacteria bacterium RIFCSPLOWO2_01_FULL_43_15]
MIVLEAKNLTKKFGDFRAVDDISFALQEREILGLLGPNGAGKTTTIQMLLGVLTATSGQVSYFGKDLATHRQEIMEKVNFSSTYTNLPWSLTVKENLTFISYLYDLSDRGAKLSELSEIFNLKQLLNERMQDLSAGQLTRVNLAKAFINSPKVLLLDEPTASLDPDVAMTIRKYLLEQRADFDLSIIITSHNMAEVEELCDRVIIISSGKTIADDTPDNLAKTIELVHVELLIESSLETALSYLNSQSISFAKQGKRLKISVKEREIPKFLQLLMEEKIFYKEISIDKPTLEDFFLQVTAKEIK